MRPLNIVENALMVLEQAGHDVKVENSTIYVDGDEVTPAEAISAALSIRSMQTDI